MYKLTQLEGIGVKFRELLLNAGIEDQQQLLDACAARSGRKIIAEKTGINPKLILKWTQEADLAQINGIGEDYAVLLVHSGIQSVQALPLYTPEQVLQRLQENNAKTNLVKAMPSLSNISSWIEQAQQLPKQVES